MTAFSWAVSAAAAAASFAIFTSCDVRQMPRPARTLVGARFLTADRKEQPGKASCEAILELRMKWGKKMFKMVECGKMVEREDAPPPPRLDNLDDPWFPFEDEGGFRLANFLYREEEMSAKKIDYLLEIWALDKAKTGNLAPFNSYAQMYAAIDAIDFGDAPWQSFAMSFADDNDHPANTPWKSASYEVWYRDPSRVISNLLDNPDFDGQFDYASFVEVDNKGLLRCCLRGGTRRN
ncbi:hypothetical protein H1R20_g9824, partial [Candolleomyces eurysporus]